MSDAADLTLEAEAEASLSRRCCCLTPSSSGGVARDAREPLRRSSARAGFGRLVLGAAGFRGSSVVVSIVVEADCNESSVDVSEDFCGWKMRCLKVHLTPS